MTRIPIEGSNLLLKADPPRNWVIAEERVYESGKREGKNYDVDIAFCGTVKGALTLLLDRYLMQADIDSLQSLKKQLEAFHKMVEKHLTVTVRV